MELAQSTPPDEYRTQRLVLRRFTLGDSRFVLELHQNLELVRFIPSQAHQTLTDAARWITDIGRAQTPGRGWWCVDLTDGTPVGAVVLKPIPPSAGHQLDDTEIGWRQHARHLGHGYATEAAAALLTEAFRSGLPRVVAVTHPDNVRSQRVCRRLGMRHIGLTDQYYDDRLELFEASRMAC